MKAYHLIESGKSLAMVKEHIANCMRVRENNNLLAKELGVTDFFTDIRTGVLTGVLFPQEIHPDFKKPKTRNGASYPKHGTNWAAKLKAQIGHTDQSSDIGNEFGIPGSIVYSSFAGSGSCRVGSPLTESGFLWLSKEGPYAMWTPDIPELVNGKQAEGFFIAEPAASFKFNIDGARRIHKEEWDILVLQHKLAQRKSAQPELAESE